MGPYHVHEHTLRQFAPFVKAESRVEGPHEDDWARALHELIEDMRARANPPPSGGKVR